MKLKIRINKKEMFGFGVKGAKIYFKPGYDFTTNNAGEDTFSSNHPSYIKWPVTFFWQNKQYTPDFADPDTFIFYEVLGTRQRYYQGQNKILSIINNYPSIKIIACDPQGNILPLRHKVRNRSSVIVVEEKIIGGHSISGYNPNEIRI